ncbi:MAG TPA: GlxA family transcriptional regulator [Terrimicrobiaceae bacterium]
MNAFPFRPRIVLLVIPPVRELDLVGIVDVFATANHFLPPERQYQLELVTSSTQPNIEGMCGLRFAGASHYSTLAGQIDTLLVPGVQTEKVRLSPALLRWFRSRAKKCRRVGSICTGAYILAHAGLLDGKRAATHWAFVSELSSRFPKVTIDGNSIWIRDGNIYSSAGVTSGIDLSLALVEEDHGQKIALEVARMLVVFLCRPGNQAQFSVSLQEQRTENRSLRALQVWIIEHLQSDLSTATLAARVSMSERNFQRVFTKEIGKSPALYVEHVRIEAVRRRLENTTQSVDEISIACGFKSSDVMSRCFQRHLKATPSEYRARFRTSGATGPASEPTTKTS